MSEAEEVSAAVERILVKLALLSRSHATLVVGLAEAGNALVRAGMDKEAEAVADTICQSQAILEEARG